MKRKREREIMSLLSLLLVFCLFGFSITLVIDSSVRSFSLDSAPKESSKQFENYHKNKTIGETFSSGKKTREEEERRNVRGQGNENDPLFDRAWELHDFPGLNLLSVWFKLGFTGNGSCFFFPSSFFFLLLSSSFLKRRGEDPFFFSFFSFLSPFLKELFDFCV